MDRHEFVNIILDRQYLEWLWDGFVVTLGISLLAIVAATMLGLFLAGLRDSNINIFKGLVIGYCALFRYTPLLVQLFFWYFAVGKYLPAGWLPWLNGQHEIRLFGATLYWPSFEFLSGLFGLTLYFAAFISEEIRAGISGVARGQKNAALALGLTGWQSMRYVILPQALRITFSPLLGQYMNIIKSSSLTMAIGVAELSYASRQVETASLKAFQAFGVATLLYITVIALIEALAVWHQHKNLAKAGY